MTTRKAPEIIRTTLDTTTKTSDSFQASGRPVRAELVAGTGFVGNLRLQRSRDLGTTWQDIIVFTAADIVVDKSEANFLYRLTMAGVGDFTSGSADVYLGE